MRNVTKDNITDVFKGYMSDDMNPRMREVMGSLVQHIHDFARETNLTHAEWRAGMAFMMRHHHPFWGRSMCLARHHCLSGAI